MVSHGPFSDDALGINKIIYFNPSILNSYDGVYILERSRRGVVQKTEIGTGG